MAADTSDRATTTDSEYVTMICPNLACRRTVSSHVQSRGKTVRCVHCNTPFRVPSSDGGGIGAELADGRNR